MNSFITDLRYGARRLVMNPGFTAAAVLTLALGIGANTAIYSVVDALMLRPLPYREPATLVQMNLVTDAGFMHPNLKYEDYLRWRDERSLFTQVEAFDARSQTYQGGGEPEHLSTAALTGGMMEMLGVPAQVGRTLQPADARPGHDRVAVISDSLWKRHFGGRADAVGQTIKLDDQTYEVVGVMPSAFKFPYMNRQVWVPLVPVPPAAGSRTARYETLAQLAPGLTVQQVQERVAALSTPQSKIHVLAFGARRVNRPVEQALYAFAGAVILLLLIASANLANLLLVQGAGRDREVAVRASLGAARGRLVRQLLTETALIAAAGGAAGVVLAMWGVDVLRAAAPNAMTFLSNNEIVVDRRSLFAAVLLTAVSALLFGAMPALKASRVELHDALKAGARSASGAPVQGRLRGAFVIAQLALSLVLLVGAGLLTRTFIGLTRIDPGFDTRNLLAATISLPSWKYSTPATRQEAIRQVDERLRSIPGLAGMTRSDGVPPGGGGVMFGLAFEIDGRGVVLKDSDLLVPYVSVDNDYFRVLRLPIVRGRGFTPEDTQTSPRTIVINQFMAERLFGTIDVVGQRLRLSDRSPWYTVVGVTANVYQFDHARPHAMFNAYFPASQGRGDSQYTFIMRTAGGPQAFVPAVKGAIWSVDPAQPIFRVETAVDMYREFFAEPRFYAMLMTIFGAMGIAIAAIGLYGVLSYTVAQRTREFGIRLALGATRTDIMRLALRHGAALTAAGLLLGCAGSIALAPYLATMIVGLPPFDPPTYTATIAVLAAAALVASWLPARRATRTDPMQALRQE